MLAIGENKQTHRGALFAGCEPPSSLQTTHQIGTRLGGSQLVHKFVQLAATGQGRRYRVGRQPASPRRGSQHLHLVFAAEFVDQLMGRMLDLIEHGGGLIVVGEQSRGRQRVVEDQHHIPLRSPTQPRPWRHRPSQCEHERRQGEHPQQHQQQLFQLFPAPPFVDRLFQEMHRPPLHRLRLPPAIKVQQHRHCEQR